MVSHSVCEEQVVTESLTINCCNLHQKEDAIAANRALEAGMCSSNAGQSLELISFETSDLERDRERGMQARKRLVKLLDDRLRILEEDDEAFKGVFMKMMKERSELITEVREYFEGIPCGPRFRPQESEKMYSRGYFAIEPLQSERRGLLQVLSQESNPSLLTRGQSAQTAVNLHES